MTALIANGGTLYQPFVVSHIGTEGEPGYQLENAPSVLAELELEADALATVREGMCKVTTVEDLGTAEFVFASAEYSLCGKTGTAETLGNPHAWFVAYWPPPAAPDRLCRRHGTFPRRLGSGGADDPPHPR